MNDKYIIKLTGNKECTFENTTININNNYIAPQQPYQIFRATPFDKDTALAFKHMTLPKGGLITETPFETELTLLEKLEEFHNTTVRSHLEPTIRILATFSGLCTQWEKSNMSDLAQMELREKELLAKLVQAGCHIKAIVNLDVQKAISCGFTRDEVLFRTADLCSVCDTFSSYSNFEIAVAITSFTYESKYILDGILINQQVNFSHRKNYSCSWWNSNQNKIMQSCDEFDRFFSEMYQKNIFLMENLNFQKASDIICFRVNKKLAELQNYRRWE